MGKIKYIKKARKEHKCSKCGKVIAVGEPYKKGVLNFSRDIVVCNECPLKSYEVTTSTYIKSVGEIVEDWRGLYGCTESTPDVISQALQDIMDELENSLDNMPDNLRDSPTGELLQNRIDSIDSALGELAGIDYSLILSESYNEAKFNVCREEGMSDGEYNNLVDEEAGNLIDDSLGEAIEQALECIEY